MKKVFMFAILVIALFVISCSKSVKNTSVSNDSTTIVVDSVSNDSTPILVDSVSND
jgi:hypothetical protein